MTTIMLEDHDLSLTEYSACELRLQILGAVLAPPGEIYTASGAQERARLASPVATFEESRTALADMEQVLAAYGFRKKSP